MADLQFIVDYTSLKKANQEILQTGSNAQKSAKVFEQAYGKVGDFNNKEMSALRKRITLSERLRKQKERETKEVMRSLDAQRKASQAVVNSYQRVKMAADPLYASEVRLKQAQRDVITAYRQGNITRREAVETMRQYRAAVQNGTLAGQGLNKGMNRMGVLFQQTGYQVGDFAVQVQSGTHMMVALGQQATQLVGTFGMLAKSTKMIAAFAGLGIIVPILTAVAGGFMRASGSAKSLTESLSDLNSKVDEYISLSENVGDFGAEGFGRVKEELKGTSDAYRDLITLAKLDAFDALSASLEKLSTTATNTNWVLGDVGEVGNLLEIETQLRGNITVWKDNREQVRLFIADLRELEGASSLDEQYQAAMRLREEFINTVGSAENMTKEQREFLKGLSESITRMEILGAAAEKTEEAVGKSSESMKKLSEKAFSFLEAAKGWLPEISPVEVKMLEVNRLVEDTAGINLAAVFQNANGWLATLLGNARALASLPIFNMMEGSAGAQRLRRYGGRGTTSDRDPTFDGESIYNILNPPSRGGSGGGGVSAAEKLKKDFESLKRSIDEAYQAQQRFKEGKAILDQQVALGNIDQAEYNRLLGLLGEKYNQAEAEGETFADHMKKIGETTKEAFKSAFTSIVDGTKSAKDAFKDMARAILKQAFDLLVVKPLLKSLFGGLTGGSGGGGLLSGLFASGGAFQNGKQLTAFADGGVVNSPTVFPMANGSGLMGEAGPEAVMPLKRGKNGKLGVQAEQNIVPVHVTVSVDNNGNLQAFVDNRADQRIAKSAPQIANLTEKKILDQRARGGAFRNTFGG